MSRRHATASYRPSPNPNQLNPYRYSSPFRPHKRVHTAPRAILSATILGVALALGQQYTRYAKNSTREPRSFPRQINFARTTRATKTKQIKTNVPARLLCNFSEIKKKKKKACYSYRVLLHHILLQQPQRTEHSCFCFLSSQPTKIVVLPINL